MIGKQIKFIWKTIDKIIWKTKKFERNQTGRKKFKENNAKSASGSGIQDEQPGSYFLELRNHFFGLKYLNSLMRIRNGDSLDPGWKKVGSGINISDPQHWIYTR